MTNRYLNNYLPKIILLSLSLLKGLGYFSIRKIYERVKPLEVFLNISNHELSDMFHNLKIKNANELAKLYTETREKLIANSEILLNNLTQRNIKFILDDDVDFPRLLLKIPDRPYWLFVEGSVRLLSRERCVAVVGSRNPTEKGMHTAYAISKQLVHHKFIIVSGLAEGIDEVAHYAVLDYQGFGIGVLGHGVNYIFPAKTANIRRALSQKFGAIITEFFPNDPYSKRSFVWRDRLQSGLSEVIIPVQGTMTSGTFHTIRYAEQQKRKIIGVYKPKLELVPQNEILAYIKKQNYPIYNISRSMKKLITDLEKYYDITLFKIN